MNQEHDGRGHNTQQSGSSIRSFFFRSNENEARRRPRQIYRISYWGVFAEWASSAIALSLLCFYSYSLIVSNNDSESTSFKLLAANVILSVYMRICYILHSASKTYVLATHGPIDTMSLPMHSQINSFSRFMCLVEPGHFVCLCWISHITFPFKGCEDLSSNSPVCTSLHIAGTIFVSMWVLTGVGLIVVVAFFTRHERNSSRNTMTESIRLSSAIPDHVREGIINSLPLTDEPPLDGEVCAVCCERDLPGASQWRLLPCGHKFHPSCVDEWLKKQGGSCPNCRHDPVSGLPQAGASGTDEPLHTSAMSLADSNGSDSDSAPLPVPANASIENHPHQAEEDRPSTSAVPASSPSQGFDSGDQSGPIVTNGTGDLVMAAVVGQLSQRPSVPRLSAELMHLRGAVTDSEVVSSEVGEAAGSVGGKPVHQA